MKQRPGDQPLPVPNEHPDIQSQVIADMEKRRKIGIERYGTALQPHNGRDSDLDAYEEAMNLTVYLKQRLVERTEDAILAQLFRRLVVDREMHVDLRLGDLVLDGGIALAAEEWPVVRKAVERRG